MARLFLLVAALAAGRGAAAQSWYKNDSEKAEDERPHRLERLAAFASRVVSQGKGEAGIGLAAGFMCGYVGKQCAERSEPAPRRARINCRVSALPRHAGSRTLPSIPCFSRARRQARLATWATPTRSSWRRR